MEEILASIKRVIRDDPRQLAQAQAPVPRRGTRAEPVPPAANTDDDVLELNEPVDSGEPLISPDAANASRHSLAALSAARAAPPVTENGALENVVRDMLRPMLKDWLDENLPQIVEELVTREIARITGRSL